VSFIPARSLRQPAALRTYTSDNRAERLLGARATLATAMQARILMSQAV
jgi:hypothetical protein